MMFLCKKFNYLNNKMSLRLLIILLWFKHVIKRLNLDTMIKLFHSIISQYRHFIFIFFFSKTTKYSITTWLLFKNFKTIFFVSLFIILSNNIFYLFDSIRNREFGFSLTNEFSKNEFFTISTTKTLFESTSQSKFFFAS